MATPEARLAERMTRLRLASRMAALAQKADFSDVVGASTADAPAGVTVGAPVPVGVPQAEVARLAGEGDIGANLTIGAADPETRARLQPIAAAARDARTPLAAEIAKGVVDLTVAPVQRAVFSPSVGEARPDPRLSKGGNSAGVPLNQPPYDAEHGAVTGEERALSGVQAAANAALPIAADLVAGPVAKTGIGRIAQTALRNAIAAGATNAPVEAAREALSAPEGERLAAAGKGLVRGAATGVVAGGLLGGGIGAVSEAAASRLATRMAKLAPEIDLPAPVLASVGVSPKGFGPRTPVPSAATEPPLAASVDEPLMTPRPIVRPEPEDMAITNVMGSRVPTPELAPAGVEERFSGPGLPAKARQAVKTAYRSALVTPYAEIEGQAPELANALMDAGAAPKRAQHIATRRLERVTEGLQPRQKEQFGKQLVLDNLDAEAARKGQQATTTSDPVEAATLLQASDRFQKHADELRKSVQPGIATQPWFQKALSTYKTEIETPLRQAAYGAGVTPAMLREPTSAYVKLVSEQRAADAEIRRALEIAGVKDESELRRRPALLRKLIGENPHLARYFATGAQGARQGPLRASVGPQGFVPRGQSSLITGSAKQALGTAEKYLTDLPRILETDVPEKVLKSARNQILVKVRQYGRELEAGEAAKPGLKVLAFDDTKGLTTGAAGVHRYEVTPEIHDAVQKFYRGGNKPSAAFRGIKTLGDFATRAQIAGMPVEATSHANTLASIIASVPGEKGLVNKALSTVPAVGGKAAAIREMFGINFKSPATRALENRLADIGALRIEEPRGGLINSSHHWLFGPEGIDVRGRLVLARKYLDRKPNATDAELREFITSKLGNYISENSGALTNFMAKGSVLSPFARFQSARIPTAVKSVIGESGLPNPSILTRLQTLYRGPIGHVAGSQALNYAFTGHSTFGNEPGHELDVNTGLAATPGRIGRATGEDKEAPLYIPAATLSPLTYAGLRATGLRAGLFSPGTPTSGKGADAVRDIANVALGTAGPFARALMIGATGTAPYLQRDNTFLRVAPRDFSGNQEFMAQLRAAVGLANPALHAFSAPAGDASRTLASSVAEDAKPFGGPLSFAAKVAEFMMPRVLSPGVGGRTNEQSVEAQLDRKYTETLRDIEQRIKRAPGPETIREIIDEAARHAEAAGYDPDAVIVTLEKAAAQDQQSVADKQDAQRKRRLEKIRQ